MSTAVRRPSVSGVERPPGAGARVLHVVENLHRGAVETWLIRMLRHAHECGTGLDWTFYCSLGRRGAQDEAASSLGSKVIHSPAPLARKLRFANALRQELRAGRYDVLHCHHDLISGVYLAAAAGLPIGRRIVHVHNADESVLTPSAWRQAIYRPALRRTCLTLADRVVGISDHSLDTFLAGRSRRQGRDLVHYYGVDARPFERPEPDRRAFRRGLGLDEEAPILLFGGRLTPEKNPVFVVDTLAQLRQLAPNAIAVFAGAGSEETAIRGRADALGVKDSVRMLGWCDDLASVMRCADWFILPRPEHPLEGFGLAVVEAQLAGLRVLVSRGVATDPLLPTAQFRMLALAEGPAKWADAAMDLWRDRSPSADDALGALHGSPMDMDRALLDLLALYA